MVDFHTSKKNAEGYELFVTRTADDEHKVLKTGPEITALKDSISDAVDHLNEQGGRITVSYSPNVMDTTIITVDEDYGVGVQTTQPMKSMRHILVDETVPPDATDVVRMKHETQLPGVVETPVVEEITASVVHIDRDSTFLRDVMAAIEGETK